MYQHNIEVAYATLYAYTVSIKYKITNSKNC